MKNWLKRGLLVMLVMGMAVPAFGGGIDNKQNFSAAYAGSLSRNAATDGADIAAYNPAGMMLLENGLHVQLDLQPYALDYSHSYSNSEYSADSKHVVPTSFGIYKHDNWAVWGAFTINGGGGELEYDNGNIITEQIGNSIAAGALAAYGIPAGGTLAGQYAYAESYDYTLTTGLAYKLNDMISLAAGLRYVITEKDVDIHGTYSGLYIAGKYSQEADGYGCIFGVNIHPNDNLNIGIRYSTEVDLDWETKTDGSTAVGLALLNSFGRVDGQSYPRDLPAVLALGLEWKVMPKLTVKPSFTVFFEDEADWGSQNYAVDSNSYEFGLGLQYDINDIWSVTAGYLYIDVDMKPENYGIIEKMSPPLDCHAVAVGARYKMSDRLTLTFGLAGYFYVSDSAPATYLVPNVLESTPEVTYDKDFYQAAIGIQYRFF